MKFDDVAEFSKIKFNSTERELFDKQLADILQFVKQVEQVHVDVKEQYDMIVEMNELRCDEVKPGLSIDDVLLNAPRKQGRYFIVPKVVD